MDELGILQHVIPSQPPTPGLYPGPSPAWSPAQPPLQSPPQAGHGLLSSLTSPASEHRYQGVVTEVKMSVQYMSFSAHVDVKGIMQLISWCEPENVMLVHGEGEKMKFDTNTDLGRRFKEAWIDRIVMDKRAVRADMALRRLDTKA